MTRLTTNDAKAIAGDPAWLPHRIDTQRRCVEFLYVPRDELAQTGFLADRKPTRQDGQAFVEWDEVANMQPEPGQIHFVFHTAFCRSTLLIRSLDLPGTSVGLNEPGIIASLVNAGNSAAHLVAPILALLARPHTAGETVFVKPTNHANMLMPAILRARPDANAILMSNPLSTFLTSTARKGMMGRRWGRQLFLEMQSYAGMDFGMDSRESFSMTDLQAAGLAWFLAQRWFKLHLDGQVQGIERGRLRSLDGDRFNMERAATYRAISGFAGTNIGEDQAQQIAQGPVFSQHSKLGGEFVKEEAKDKASIESKMLQEEIGQVSQWIDAIAKQAGIEIPIPQSLF